jgi:LysM repeat protein
LATSIASSVGEYLTGTAIAPENDEESKTNYYKVKRGDTLFSVAGRFNTKVAVLLKLNNMKLEDPLFVDQKIIVPANKNEDEDNEKINAAVPDKKDKSYGRKKAFRIYTVKKGDTLFLLAKDNSTTVQELLKINNMKSTEPLLYGQKIKLPKKAGNI